MNSIKIKCSYCNNTFTSEGLDYYVTSLKEQNQSLEEKCQNLEKRIASDFEHSNNYLTHLVEEHKLELSRATKQHQDIQAQSQKEISHLKEKLDHHRWIIIIATLLSLYCTYSLIHDSSSFIDISLDSFFKISATWFSSFCFLHILDYIDSIIKRFVKNKE